MRIRSIIMETGAQDVGSPQPGNAKRRTSATMTDDEQRERRASIREIMNDTELTPLERRRSIQALMDGRRRSSGGGRSIPANAAGSMSMMAAAAAAAAEFYDSDDSDDGSNEPGGNRQQSHHDGSDDHDDDDGGVASAASSVSSRAPGRRPSFRGFHHQRRGRSASLKAFAHEAQVVAAAAAAAAAEFSDDPADDLHTAQRMERSRPRCSHYRRNCTIVAPCCGLAFGCRICHDDCPVLPPPSETPPSKTWSNEAHRKRPKVERRRKSLPMDFQEEDTHHAIDRFAITEVICRECYTRQDSKSNYCINCDIQFGEYHCERCNLWMSAEDDPYHCLDCGFCRVGGRENFAHCHDCGMCIDALLFGDHNCKAGKYMSNCPVCQEDLFSSRSASHEMPCGHAIHWDCFRRLTSFDTRCPVCKRTAETREQMAPTWSAMAVGISLQPVPPDMARVVTIVCNDCDEADEDRRWHFLGVQCTKCTSFNTTVKQTTLMGLEAAAFLGDEGPDDGAMGGDHSGSGLSSHGVHHMRTDGTPPNAAAAGSSSNMMGESVSSFEDDLAEARRATNDRLLSTLQAQMESALSTTTTTTTTVMLVGGADTVVED